MRDFESVGYREEDIEEAIKGNGATALLPLGCISLELAKDSSFWSILKIPYIRGEEGSDLEWVGLFIEQDKNFYVWVTQEEMPGSWLRSYLYKREISEEEYENLRDFWWGYIEKEKKEEYENKIEKIEKESKKKIEEVDHEYKEKLWSLVMKEEGGEKV